MKRITLFLVPAIVMLLQSCSPYSVTKASIFNQYPGQPSGKPETIISFELTVKSETTILPTITLEGSDKIFTIREVYSSSNEILSIAKPIQEGKYRVVATSDTVFSGSEKTTYIVTLNNKKYCYDASRIPDVRMK